MNGQSPLPSDEVAAWVKAHRNKIGGTQVKLAWREEYSRMFCAEYETPAYLIQICAWDHACCLDIIAESKIRGANAYFVAGECNGTNGLLERLNSFLHWLDSNEPNRNA